MKNIFRNHITLKNIFSKHIRPTKIKLIIFINFIYFN